MRRVRGEREERGRREGGEREGRGRGEGGEREGGKRGRGRVEGRERRGRERRRGDRGGGEHTFSDPCSCLDNEESCAGLRPMRGCALMTARRSAGESECITVFAVSMSWS